MKRLTIIIALVVAAGACGCCHHEGKGNAAHAEQALDVRVVLPDQPMRPRMAPHLIFDRHPGAYSADQFAVRNEWPSTFGYLRAPEVVFYREHFRDRQGPGMPFHDTSYRRSDTVRYGQAIR